MADVTRIEGIGKVYAARLEAAGIGTVEALLVAGATPQGRGRLAEATGISGKRLLRWVNLADLHRIKGVAEEFSDLLEAAGVDTVVELARRKPENLHKTLVSVQKAKRLTRAVPSQASVSEWIKQAATLPRVVTY
jgi:predicted flap endonuclease-1-like 5' DNA nuclease